MFYDIYFIFASSYRIMNWKKENYKFYGYQEYITRIDHKKAMLDSFRPIPSILSNKLKESLYLEWTYNSNGIEGNTLSLRETQLVVQHGLTISGKALKEHLEAINHQDAIEYVEELASDNFNLKVSDIKNIHSLVLQRIEKEFVGRFRLHPVRISGANFTPPEAIHVPDFMDDLMHWLENETSDIHPILRATIFHHRFVWIHPFIDGNGRTVRICFNLLLMKEGFPPGIILKNDRKKYYSALDDANNGDYSKLFLMVLQSIERSLDIYLGILKNTYHDYKPIQDIVNEPDVPYSQEYVSLLARRGRIDAYKDGRNWLTTKSAVKEYINTRKRIRKLS